MSEYAAFLERKRINDPATGLRDIPALNPMLFDFQRDIVTWALKRGRAAIFADCGMGKTPMQLEWARHIPGKVLILAPLAVSLQTQREGEKFGVKVGLARKQSDVCEQITVTNYEMLDHFDLSQFSGLVLDESSILKAHDGKTRARIIEISQQVPFRLACIATPAPNDYMELGNHAEFLGSMSRAEMLAMFFVHDGGETQKWRIKGHAQADFWRWVCSWAVMIRKPSDLGYSDDGFTLPEMVIHEIVVRVDEPTSGFLFPVEASSLQERLRARRDTIADRVADAAKIANATDRPFLLWCNLNDESAGLAAAVNGAVEVSGSDSNDVKERRMLDFTAGNIRAMVSKPSIAGFGMNWQHCADMAFVGLSDSYEQFYQAVRRCYRFGQTKTVNVYVITAETEGAVVANIKRKEADAMKMAEEMVGHMRDLNMEALHGATVREKTEYQRDRAEGDGFVAHLGDCVDVVSELPSDSIHYTVYSPPFSSLYTYSNSDRDMGNCKGDGEFMEHYRFLVGELYRVTMPGRLLSFHCMNLPTSKQNHGYIGIRDFRGELIKMHEEAGFIYHSEVCIWKDPVIAMQRTKALGLLHKQIKKDSCMSRQGIPDYLVTMRKPGENPERVSHTAEDFPVQLWQQYASPVWMDINPSETLQYRSAREHNDERHICPLQLEVIRRALKLWTNPGDTVLSPFMGIGSEGYCSIQAGRKFVGAELKRSYWNQAVKNLTAARTDQGLMFELDNAAA
jgi:DNA methylase